jgi:Tol biopolymer transport system component
VRFIIKKIVQVIFVLLAMASASACPNKLSEEHPREHGVQATSLKDTSGLYLVYMVNEYQRGLTNNSNTGHVLIASPDGERRELLFNHPQFIYHIVPSPAGTHIAFVASVQITAGYDEKHLWIFNLETGRMQDVSSQGQNSRNLSTTPIFSPDGSKVFFLSKISRDTGQFHVFECDVATLTIRGLYTQPVEEVPITVIPGTGRICVVQRSPEGVNNYSHVSIDSDTGETETLHTYESITKLGPAFIDRNFRTIFTDTKPYDPSASALSGMRSRNILSVDIAFGTETELAMEEGSVSYVYQIFMDSDGVDKLLLRRQVASENEETPVGRIMKCDLDGTNQEFLTPEGLRTSWQRPPSNVPPVSYDGSLIFYFRKDPVFDFTDLYVMNTDGTNSVNVSNTAGYSEEAAGWLAVK